MDALAVIVSFDVGEQIAFGVVAGRIVSLVDESTWLVAELSEGFHQF